MEALTEFFSRPALWFVAGLVLVFSEFIVPGVMICFFGIAAMLMAGLLLIWPGMPSSLLLALYIATSLALLFGLRRYLPKTFRGRKTEASSNPDDDDVAGSRAVVVEAIAPDRPGKVEFRGTNWSACADTPVAAGETVEILKRDNLMLTVRSLKS